MIAAKTTIVRNKSDNPDRPFLKKPARDSKSNKPNGTNTNQKTRACSIMRNIIIANTHIIHIFSVLSKLPPKHDYTKWHD